MSRSSQHFRHVLRSLRGLDVWQTVQQRCPTITLGNQGANWSICPTELSRNSIIYCVGAGEEISFDLELIARFGVRVYAFDPTPRSIQWVRAQTLPEQFLFQEYGVADFDGICRFIPPADPRHVSHTMVQREVSGPAIEAPVYRLATIMKMLGHRELSLLKMDIEGAEYRVLRDMLDSNIRPKQVLVEFHDRWPEIGPDKTRVAVRDLNAAGYRIFHVSPRGEEYSFKLNP